MEKILSALNGLTETWLTLGSASYHIDLNYTLLSGLGLLLLYILYLILKLLIHLLWREKYTPKLWEKGKKRRQTLTGGPACQREAEQRRELRTTQPSSLEEPSEASSNELPLHRDPLLPVCDRSGDVGHQLSQDHLKDGKASHLCVASTVPGTEASFVLSSLLTGNQAGHSAPALPQEPLPLAPSILSPNCFAPLEGFYSSTLLHDSLTPESTLPLNPPLLLDPTPPYPLASFPLPTREAQKSEVVVQLETTRSLVDRLNEMPTNVPPAQGTGCVRQTMPEASQEQPAADNQLSSDSKNQYLPAPRVPQVPLQGNTRAYHVEPGYLFFPNSNAVKLSQRLDKKVSDFLMVKGEQEEWEEEEEEEDKGCFIKSPSSSEKLLSGETLGEPQDLVASHSSSSKGKLTHQPLPHSKTFEDHEELQPSLLFWGPPSLHSETLSPTTTNAYDRSSALVCFNSMAEASIADYSHGCMLPTPLHAYRPQTWLQTTPQSHPQRDPPAELQPQPQPQPQSRVSVLTFSRQSELRDCGVHFHRPQGDEQPLSPSEMQCLEYNILKKEQERVWGLPLVVKKSQDTFCPSPPKVLLGSRSSKACTPRPILPGDFPLTSELEKKLEHHLRKRLIQHRWGLPDRIDKSLSLLSPQSELIDFSESQKNQGLSWITFFKYQGNKDSQVLSGGSSRSWMPKRHSLRETRVKERTYSQDQGHKDQSRGNNFQEASQNSVQSHLKTHWKSRTGRQPPKFSSPSQVKQYQRGIEKALEKHLNKKIREISRGEIPITVNRSRHSVNMANIAQPPPESSPKRMKDQAPLAYKEHVLTRHPHSLALSPSKEKMLEQHITAFRRRMAFGLPQRVEESLESYSTKAEPSQPFPQLHVQAHNVSRADPAKSSRSLRRNTTGDRMGTVNSVPTQQKPLPAASLVGHSQPASENKVCVDRDLSVALRGREPTQHWAPRRADKGDVPQSGSHNKPGPELPMSPGGPTHERLASSTNTQGSQEERRSGKDGSEAEGSTELHKGEQLPGLHPQSTKSLKGTQDLCSPGSPVTACQSPQGMTISHNSESPDSKSQVSTEVQPNSEGRTHNQVPDLPATPFAPQEMTSKPQGPSGGDMAVSQVLHVHMPSVGISMESRQGPWVPAYVSGKSKNKDCLPAARGLPQLATEAGKFGGGDAGLGTSQTTGKGHCVQARAPEETQRLTASPALTPKSQPQENQFTSQVKGFWQRLSPGKKHKGQEKSLAKGCSPLASGKGTSPIKGRSEFCGNPEAQNCVRVSGMVLRKQLGHRHGTVTPYLQAPVSPLMGSEGAQQEVPLQAQAEPIQRLPHLCCRCSCSQVPRAESCSPGQGQTASLRCGPTGKAKRVETSPVLASPPKSSL